MVLIKKKFSIKNGESYKPVIDYLMSIEKKIFLLEGDVGVGKTTFTSSFIKSVCEETGVDFDSLNVMSPTYSIINEYKIIDQFIFHSDFYRLEENPLELEEVLELIAASKYSFIEWHEKMESLKGNLNDFVKISFKFLDRKTRELILLSY